MKTNGATWNKYLDSWPDGQWYDDCDETVNGKEFDEARYPDDAVIEFTCGIVYTSREDYEGSSLVRHFNRWLKEQSCDFVMCQVPKERMDEFKQFLKSIDGKITKEKA